LLRLLLRVKSAALAADREPVSTQISAPVRIVALVGLLAALAMGAWMYTAGAPTESVSDNGEAAQPVAAAKSAAGKLDAHNKATAAGKPHVIAPAATAAAKPAEVTKPSPKPTPAAPKIIDGTPTTIASALRSHRVVVVLLYDPKSQVDAYSVGEARLGAKNAHAGFLRVNVLRERQARPFVKAYGVVQAPAVLFFARPGTVVQKLVGFADHESVTQAALNAARGGRTPQG